MNVVSVGSLTHDHDNVNNNKCHDNSLYKWDTGKSGKRK